jgi:hypothetical protein
MDLLITSISITRGIQVTVYWTGVGESRKLPDTGQEVDRAS